MRRKNILVGIGLVLLALVGAAYHLIFGYVESEQISERITVLTRKSVLTQIGGNVVAYVGDKGTIIVDTQLPSLASSTRSQLDGLAKTGIATVLITHWHPDHSGGISAFSGDADIIAHENVLKRLSAPQEGFGLTKPGSYHQFDARSSGELPTKTVADRLDLATDSGTVDVIHYENAHTDGDLVVYFQNTGVTVIGDLVWPDSFPYIDVHNGGSVTGLELALGALLARSQPGDRFIPGHGATQSFADVDAYLEMVSKTREWVESQLSEGQTVEQIISSGLPKEWEKWSSRLVPSAVWIEMIYASRGTAMAVAQ